ncbi:MAG: TIGR02186 family protein [Pseudomonadota bacterium]
MRALILSIAVLLTSASAQAEEVVAGLSQDAISITTNFDGSEIIIFGAVRREAPPPGTEPMHVIITVEGPSREVVVRRKDRRFGIWVNTEAAEVDAAPTFYAVSTTGPIREVIDQTEDLRHRITVPRAIRAVDTMVGNPVEFVEALIRIRLDEELYQLNEGAVRFREETLFDTAVRLPANLVEGDYQTRIFLTRGGEVVDVFSQAIPVRKVGLERFIYTLAHEQPLVYGILSLTIAIIAGWLASAVFRYIQT